MELLKRIFTFYIFSNLHVSLAAFSLTKITLIDFGIHENTTPTLVFFATFISYNFIRYMKLSEIYDDLSYWLKVNQILMIVLNLIGLVILLLLALNLRFKAFLILIPFALVIFFYVIPFRKGNKNLRNIASFKLSLIAVSWAGVTVLFPLLNQDIVFSGDVWIVFIQRFLFILAIAIPFDIRDLKLDAAQLKTLPQSIGVLKSKLIGVLSLSLFFMLTFFLASGDSLKWITNLLIAVASVILLILANKDQKRFYSSFWVDALPVFWLILIIILSFSV